MPTSAEAQGLIEFDPEYVYLRRYDFSVSKVLERYPDGAPDHIIAQALLCTEDDVQRIYQSAVTKLRDHLKVDL
jgi:hypothetical protein